MRSHTAKSFNLGTKCVLLNLVFHLNQNPKEYFFISDRNNMAKFQRSRITHAQLRIIGISGR